MRTLGHWAARQIRRADLDANPLRRGSDRAEAWLRVSLVAVFLIAGPLMTIAASHWAGQSGISAARAQAAAKHQVRAVLLRNVPLTSTYPAPGSAELAWVAARWTAPDGISRTGDVPAATGTIAGSTVTIWTDASGTLADPPIGHAQILGRVITFVTVTPAALAVLLLSVLWVIRRVLDRRRLASWETAWTTVEPQWTRRRH